MVFLYNMRLFLYCQINYQRAKTTHFHNAFAFLPFLKAKISRRQHHNQEKDGYWFLILSSHNTPPRGKTHLRISHTNLLSSINYSQKYRPSKHLDLRMSINFLHHLKLIKSLLDLSSTNNHYQICLLPTKKSLNSKRTCQRHLTSNILSSSLLSSMRKESIKSRRLITIEPLYHSNFSLKFQLHSKERDP